MQTLRYVAKAGLLQMLWAVLATYIVIAHLTAFDQVALAGDSSLTSQKLLFDKPYLGKLALPSSLIYTYSHRTSEEKRFGKAFIDTISVDVDKTESAKHKNSVSLRIFTGKRERRLGPHRGMMGNPIIMAFLERDLWEMKRRAGGVPIYYRNKIRKAMREAASVAKIEAEFDGKLVPAHRVTIVPFKDEKNNQRLSEFLNKSYEFTVSDMVPGGFLKARSAVPGVEGAGDLLVEDELVFQRLE